MASGSAIKVQSIKPGHALDVVEFMKADFLEVRQIWLNMKIQLLKNFN